jgi:hypothetical protein
MRTLRHIRRIFNSERGFTMIVTLGVLLVSGLLMTAAFVAAEGDLHLTQNDTAAKRAYYAAQAGIQDYEYHLTQDGNYLNYCTEPSPANEALNQLYKEGTKETPLKASELKKVEVPGSEGKEKYALQLVPAESAPTEDKKCDKTNVVGTMVEQKEKSEAAGSFRLQSTGFAEGKMRTIVATLRNLNFVSFVWYSVYETGDSVLYSPPQPNCGQYYGSRPACKTFDNYFISKELVNGPMHTEDHVGVCGTPVFGRNPNDRIEFGNGTKKAESETGYSAESGCAESESKPTFNGTHIPPSKTLSIKPPPGDEELEHVVETSPKSYKYKNKTEFILTGETMTVKEYKLVEKEKKFVVEVKETKGVTFPPNGVIYVSGACGKPYSPFGPVPLYNEDTECGNVYVHGEYKKPLTIAAQNDVIINGNITTPVNEKGQPTTNAMLGLIANNFVRLFHPLTGVREKAYTKCGTAKNDTTEEPKDLEKPTIYAAMLAVKHSFIVDNFDCGKPELGSLKIYGAIASLFTNGMTGVFSGTTALTGYPYNLEYDNRLEVAEPPHFLNPIEAAWYVQRETLAPTPAP